MPAAYRRETTYDRNRDSRKNPAERDTDGCPACSNEGMVGTKYPTVWICERCSAVFGSVMDEAQSYEIVKPMFLQEDGRDLLAEGLGQYFDLMHVDADGNLQRRHGWYDPQTRFILQVG